MKIIKRIRRKIRPFLIRLTVEIKDKANVNLSKENSQKRDKTHKIFPSFSWN